MSNSANWKKQKIQLRRGTAAEWVSRNTLLLPGEVGYETDTGRQKIGDGVTRWNQLAYWVGGGVAPDDPRLTDSREWSAGTISQADAEAGSSTERKAFTAQRVFQAIAAWWTNTADKQKLDGIASGATANSSDAHLLARENHTGTQAISTVTDLQDALDAKAPLASPTFTGTVGGITKTMVGLGNVDNTSDADKPISTATQTALNAKAPVNNPTFTGTVSGVTKSMVGLGNVDNTSDLNKPISTATQTALDGKQAAGSYATLVNGTVPSNQLPGFVDDVLEYTNFGDLPVTGVSGVLYVVTAENKVYRWSGSQYIEIVGSPGSTDAISEGVTNLYYTDARASAAAPVQSVAGRTGTVVLAKADVGLGNVDNTSDADKPVSTATQTALAGKVDTSDARLTDSRTPTAHKTSHATGGSDALSPADIGAAPAASPAITGNATFEASSGVPVTITNTGTGNSFVVNDGAGDTTPFVVDAEGRVGIGTFTPASNSFLEVRRDQASSGTAYSSAVRLTNGQDWGYGVGVDFAQPAVSGGEIVVTSAIVSDWDSNNNFSLRFHTMSAGTTAERVRISANGSLLVGTTTASSLLTVNGVITVSATSGSAGSYAPSVTFSGDPNTGFGQVNGQSDTASIFTAGHERVRVDSSGRVAIAGTTTAMLSTADDLVVGGGSGEPGMTFYGSTTARNTLAFADGTAGTDAYRGYLRYTHSSDDFRIATAATERMLIDSSGNVGIGTGTTTPASRLDVNGVITVSAGTAAAPALVASGDANTGLLFPAADTFAISTAGVERLRIDSSGNVGIGTGSSTPAGRLEIRNDVTSGNANVRFTNGLNWGYGVQVEFAQPTSNGAAIAQTGAIINGWDSDDNFSLRFRTMAAGTVAERLRVDASGKVGIATTSPTAFLDINADKIRLRTAKTPASASDTGNAGDICWDANFVYVCTATNTWRKARLSEDGQTFTGTTTFNGPVVEGRVVGGNTGTAKTIALTNGTLQDYTLTGNCTFTMPTATAGQSFTLMLRTGAGSYTATFTGVKWPGSTPVVTTTASRMDLFTFVSDGTNWYGNVVQGYTP